MGTAERRLEIMKYLCKCRFATMRELAEEYKVSVRTIQRDIFELTFFMPIYVEKGRYKGGVYVNKDYTMDRMYMTTDELNLLIKLKKISCNSLLDKEKALLEYIISTYTKPT